MPAGRPTDYKPEFVEQSEKLARLGATDMEMADFFGIRLQTLYRWRVTYPEFSDSARVGKEFADNRVERSLFQRAIGYEQDEVKIFMPAGADEPVYAPYRARVIPDTRAAEFWLKNRKRFDWSAPDKLEVSGPDGAPVEVVNMTPREAAEAYKASIGA
jgi:hypothetical protein